MGKKEHNGSAAKKKAKKQVSRESRRSVPIPMTQDEVDALTAGDAEVTEQFARKVRAAVPSEAPLSASAEQISSKAAPPRITRSEMREIQRSGKVPKKILARLERRAAQPGAPTSKPDRKAKPEQVPPGDTVST